MMKISKVLNILKTNSQTTDKQQPVISNVRNSNACPLCGVLLNPIPKRKTKCSACHTDVYVRSKQTLFNSDLLTEEYAFTADFFKELEYIGATKEQYIKTAEELSVKWGFTPKPYDVVWNLSTKMIVSTPRNYGMREGLDTICLIYAAQANYLENRKIDPYTPRLLLNETELDKISIMGDFVKGVEAITNGCCKQCEAICPKTATIEHYKETKLLPYKQCTRKLKTSDDHSWCVCYYAPIIKAS